MHSLKAIPKLNVIQRACSVTCFGKEILEVLKAPGIGEVTALDPANEPCLCPI